MRFLRYVARRMPPTPLRMWEGQRTWVLSVLGHRSSPDPSLRLRPSTTPARRPASSWPTPCGRARRSCSSPRCSAPAGPARPSSRSGSRTRCGRRGRSTCWPGFPPASRSAIIAGYARAAADLELLADEETPPATADERRAALPRLAAHDRAPLGGGARRRGLPGRHRRAVAAGPGGAGRRDQPAAGVGARPAPSASVTAHAVAGFSRREALAYLNARLTGFPDQRIEALDLAEDLGGLPIALAQAAAVISRDREHLPGLPGRVRGSACRPPRRRSSTAARSRCSPPGRSPSSTPTSCRRPACPGPRSCSPRPLTPAGSRPRSSPPPPRAPTSPGGPQATDLAGSAAGAGQRRPGPRAVRLRHPGTARPAQRGPHQRGAHRLAAPGGAGRGPRLPGAGQRRAGGGGGGRGAA